MLAVASLAEIGGMISVVLVMSVNVKVAGLAPPRDHLLDLKTSS